MRTDLGGEGTYLFNNLHFLLKSCEFLKEEEKQTLVSIGEYKYDCSYSVPGERIFLCMLVLKARGRSLVHLLQKLPAKQCLTVVG